MRAMNLTLPPFCTQPDAAWPFAEALEGVGFHSCRFDPAALDDDDFARCSIPTTPSIQRSVAKRRAEYLAGRLCARAALQALTGQAEVPATGEDRAPVWPAGVVGSITHGTGQAASVVARAKAWRGLGLDLEQRLEPERALRLAGEILTEAELQRLDALPLEARAERVTLTFSIKESLFKALYPLVGVRFYFHDAEVLAVDGHRVQLRLLIDLSAEWHQGREVQGQVRHYPDRLLTLVAVR